MKLLFTGDLNFREIENLDYDKSKKYWLMFCRIPKKQIM